MIKDIILRQREERERLMSFSYVEREKIAEAKKWMDTGLIKVILGPRRAGKSIFSLMLLKDRPFAYFNFDDDNLPEPHRLQTDEFMQALHEVYGETKTILFDEIQNLPRWELFANRLHRAGYNLVLTGSNAHLLSQELATHLTGRHMPFEILPFNFREFIRSKSLDISPDTLALPERKGRFLALLHEYMIGGGFPEVVVRGIDVRNYLPVLYTSILFKDVVKRYRVKFSEQIDRLGLYFVNSTCSPYSIRRLMNTFGFRSTTTVEKYLRYLQEAYLFYSLHQYSFKPGERLSSPKKAYVVDNGFITAKAVQHSADQGKFLESMVFIELVKAGYEPNRHLFYYHTRNKREVDFMLREGTSVSELIQVVYSAADPDVEKREIKALLEAGEELGVEKLTVLTWDEKRELKKGGATIHFVPVWERFLGM